MTQKKQYSPNDLLSVSKSTYLESKPESKEGITAKISQYEIDALARGLPASYFGIL